MINHCPTCKGTGKVKCTVIEYVGGENKSDTCELNCIDCQGGINPLSDAQSADLKKLKIAQDKLWCKCEGHHGATYVADGVSKKCSKHHWTCNKCGKILQIG